MVVVFWANWDPIGAKWEPSGQFIWKVGESALELGKKILSASTTSDLCMYGISASCQYKKKHEQWCLVSNKTCQWKITIPVSERSPDQWPKFLCATSGQFEISRPLLLLIQIFFHSVCSYFTSTQIQSANSHLALKKVTPTTRVSVQDSPQLKCGL